MPTRNRPELLERAIGSVIEAAGPVARQVEVAVSDGSSDDASGQVVARLLADWPGGYRYVWNRPALDLPGNMNRATSLAAGQWILQLHDDDLLRLGAGRAVLDAAARAGPEERVLLFGVDVVTMDGAVRRTQTFRRERYLPPGEAMQRVLRNSSFVRLPAAVVHRTAFAEEGGFEATLGAACDTDMWMRLFSRYGVRCVPHTTCAYTVHEAATTTGMWNQETSTPPSGSSIGPSPAGSSPSAQSGAGRPTSSTSSSSAASTGASGCGSGRRPAGCFGCSTCRRSAALASRRDGCRCGPRSSRPPPGHAIKHDPTPEERT